MQHNTGPEPETESVNYPDPEMATKILGILPKVIIVLVRIIMR